VETTQLDVAFCIKSSDLLQWSVTKKLKRKRTNNTGRRDSLISAAFPEIWPLHDIVSINGEIGQDMFQKGTIRVKQGQGKMEKSRLVTVLKSTNDDDYDEDEDANIIDGRDDGFVKSMKSIYSADLERILCPTTSQLSINRHDVFSTKLYSTLAHFLLPHKRNLPITISSINSLHTCSMIQLQRDMDTLNKLSKDSLEQLMNHGIHARIEVSVRPGLGGNNDGVRLRSQGHLVDLMSHVFGGLFDLLNHDRYKIDLHKISPRLVHEETQFLIKTVRDHLCQRSSNLFDSVYIDQSTHVWLKAMVCFILTKIGFAHHFKLSPIKQWLVSNRPYDPEGIGHSVSHGIPLRTRTTPGNSLIQPPIPQEELVSKLQDLLASISLSPEGIATVSEIARNRNSSYRLQYHQMSLLDKLKLSQSLSQFIIPSLSSHLVHNGRRNYLDVDTRIEDHWEGDMLATVLHPFGELDEGSDHHQPSFTMGRGHSSNLLRPMLTMIDSLNGLCKFFDPATPTYLFQLFHYIELCHERSMPIPLVDQPLQNLPQPSGYLKNQLTNFYQSSSSSLSYFLDHVLRELNLSHGSTHHNPPTSPLTMQIRTLCEHYLFPCSLADYHNRILSLSVHSVQTLTQLQDLNHLVFHSVNEGFVRRLPSPNPKIKRYYRNIDNITVSIVSANHLLTIDRQSSHWVENQAVPGDMNLFWVLERMFHTNSSPRFPASPSSPENRGLFWYLRDFLSRTTFVLSDYFLNSVGQTDPYFKDIISSHDLETVTQYPIQPESLLDSSITDYCPRIILPLTALVFECHILFHDVDLNKSHLHFYDQVIKRVITYQLRGVKMKPNVPCFILRKMTNSFISSNVINPGVCCPPAYTSNFPQESLLPVNTLSQFKHSMGDMMRVKTGGILQCILRVMRVPWVQHPQLQPNLDAGTRGAVEKDPLSIQHFLDELSGMGFHLEDIAEEDVLSDLRIMGISTLSRLSRYLNSFSNRNRPEYFKALCPVLCLKYKLWFAVWHQKGEKKGDQSTYLYWFHSESNKAGVLKLPHNFFFVKHKKYVVYVRVCENKKKEIKLCNYWNLSRDNPFNPRHICQITPPLGSSLLLYKFSYADGPLLQQLWDNMKNSYGSIFVWDIQDVSLTYQSFPVPPMDDATQPTVIKTSIKCAQNNKFLGYGILAIFPFSTQDGNYPVVFIHSSTVGSSLARSLAVEVMEIALTNSLYRDIGLCLHEYKQGTLLSSSLLMVLYSFIVGTSNSVSQFDRRARRLNREPCLAHRTTLWLSSMYLNSFSTLQESPPWLRQILD
jgi:hypothetical protein